MKKLLVLIVLMIGLTGCGKNEHKNNINEKTIDIKEGINIDNNGGVYNNISESVKGGKEINTDGKNPF